MDSYFARHTGKLSVQDDDLLRLWDEDRVTIHYPEYPKCLGGLRQTDNDSRDPEDYEGTAQSAMRCLKELGDNGGYVWTESRVSGSAKVGIVKPGTDIEVCEAEWCVPDGHDHRATGDRAVLKTLRLAEKIATVHPGQAMGLRAGRPQQGTIVRWHKCGTRLAAFVRGEQPDRVWDNLSTEQQEAACAEFLRLQRNLPDIPKLRRLLLPVGRTLEDVDIYGMDERGRKVFAQVTYLRDQDKKVEYKVAQLEKYGPDEASLVFFCRCEEPGERGGVRFVSVEGEVMDWVLSSPQYAEAL